MTEHHDEQVRLLLSALERLRLDAGQPSYRELSRRISSLPYAGYVSHDSVHRVFTGGRLPAWPRLRPVVQVLGGDTYAFQQMWIAAKHGTPPHPKPDHEAFRLQAHQGPATALCMTMLPTPSGQAAPLVITASQAGEIRVWDLSSRTLRSTYYADSPVTALAATALRDSTLVLAGAGSDGQILLLELFTAGSVAHLRSIDASPSEPLLHPGSEPVTTIATNRPGHTPVAYSNNGSSCVMWDLGSRSQIGEVSRHNPTATAIVTTDDGATLWLNSNDEGLWLWDGHSAALIEFGHYYDDWEHCRTGIVTAMAPAYLSDRPILMVADKYGDVVLNDMSGGPRAGSRLWGKGQRLPHAARTVSSAATSRSDVLIAAGGDSVHTWDMRTGDAVLPPLTGDNAIVGAGSVTVGATVVLGALWQDGTLMFASLGDRVPRAGGPPGVDV
ncbi:hypothetical protein ACFCZ2_29840 [Streptomyces sp. NPDC056202]|uniref:hypothetical protein n=1 Tax=unclassified Streptomyces TaxID=2593676 RepID=UPI0035E1C8C2